MCKKMKQQNNTKMPDLADLSTLNNYGKTRLLTTTKSLRPTGSVWSLFQQNGDIFYETYHKEHLSLRTKVSEVSVEVI